MKFANGYLLGAATVIGMTASFAGGAVAYAYCTVLINEKKREAVTKIEDTTPEDLFRDFFRNKKN